MDSVDERLLDLLKTDARASTAALARRLGVARSTVQSRMARLEEQGIIAGYTVKLGPGVRAPVVRAHVMICVELNKGRPVETALNEIKAVAALYSANGEYDLIATVAADTTERLDEAVDTIRDLPGVMKTHTSVLLSTKFER